MGSRIDKSGAAEAIRNNLALGNLGTTRRPRVSLLTVKRENDGVVDERRFMTNAGKSTIRRDNFGAPRGQSHCGCERPTHLAYSRRRMEQRRNKRSEKHTLAVRAEEIVNEGHHREESASVNEERTRDCEKREISFEQSARTRLDFLALVVGVEFHKDRAIHQHAV